MCPGASCSSRSVRQGSKPSEERTLEDLLSLPNKIFGADYLGADGRNVMNDCLRVVAEHERKTV